MTKDMIIEKNIPCRLRDGVTLRADVYRPRAEGKYPVLMLRLPYDKETPRYYDEYLDVPRMVASGYAVILQDVRGRFASDGEYYPFVHERKDGYDAVQWAAELPFSNGKVGLFGMSYHGYTQLAAAVEKPPALKAIAPVMTMGNPFANVPDKKGEAAMTGQFQTWVLGSMIEDQLKRKGKLDEEKFKTYLEKLPELLWEFPAVDWKPMKELDPDSYYFELIENRLPTHVRKDAVVLDKLGNSEIPALFIGGWFDALLDPTLEMYDAYGGEKMLWIGPWTHEEMTGRAGERFFENAAESIGVDRVKDPTELHIMWFDHWLKDKPLKIEKPVHLYLMGTGEWKAFDEWPPSASVKDLFLTSDGNSQTLTGDGKLRKVSQTTETKSGLKHDPLDPVPIRGGKVLIDGYESGVFEISDIQKREDVLVYTSEPLTEEQLILGTVKAEIWISAPSPLVDIAVRISDVDKSGRAYCITDSFKREQVESINEPFCIEVEVGRTAYVLLKGHRLRVDITASKAPLYDMNLNNGTTTKTHPAETGKAATQYIHHGESTKSKITLSLF